MRNNLRCRLWLEAVQPVEEIHKHLQCILLSRLHGNTKVCLSNFHIWVIFELEVLLLERDGVVEEEIWSVLENIGDGIPCEVPMKRACDIREHKGDVVGQVLWENGG